MSINEHIGLAACWIIFGMVHSIFASDAVKNFIKRIMKNSFKFYRLHYSIVAAVMIVFILYFNFVIATIELWHPSLIEKIMSLVAGIVGLSVMAVCIRKYFFDLSGIDVFFKHKTTDSLQVNGLNKYVRHPLYAGTLLFAWSFFFWQPLLSNLISCICITLYTLIGAYFEEKRLVKTFGEDYKIYASRVPMIIPKLV
jgi:protein-S-isoprenylcysteine O-methyltransferase Ste14